LPIVCDEYVEREFGTGENYWDNEKRN
jgi:valyl-tRNA synthetase